MSKMIQTVIHNTYILSLTVQTPFEKVTTVRKLNACFVGIFSCVLLCYKLYIANVFLPFIYIVFSFVQSLSRLIYRMSSILISYSYCMFLHPCYL